MKKLIIPFILIAFLQACTTANQVSRANAYKGIYKENTQKILVMLPINNTTNVEAKEYFYGTMNIPLAERGYYIMPSFLSAEILRRESADNSEVFIDQSVSKFGEVFGVDAVLFTVIHTWKKDKIFSNIEVEVEYTLKSTSTNEVLFQRRGDIIYSTQVRSSGGGLAGLIVSTAASLINNAATDHIKVARLCNDYTLKDIPAGGYHLEAKKDTAVIAGPKTFRVTLNN